ncbi:MAG: hypothetical protein Q8904_10600 [Bacteroidota bacterium]|nr:hypothetical protein [Bacteroidota bacterium]
MKGFNRFLFLSVIVFFITACSTGSTAYQRGDYYKACLESIDRLRANPKNVKSQDVLTKAYPLAQKTALREIDNALLANTPDKYDVLVFQYDRLNQLANDIFTCPKANELIPQPTQYIAELSKAKQMAAGQAYEMGIKALSIGTLDQARMAYQYFRNADRYVTGYKDVQNKIAEARYSATLRVMVQKPFENKNYQYSADFFYHDLLAELRRNSQNRFIRYYTPEEARIENMHNPHQVVILNFEDFSIGDVKETRDTKELKRDSVLVGEVKVDGKTYNSYNTVKAKLTIFRREINTGGTLSLRILDAQNSQELQRRDFIGNYNWNTKWANFNGDDRALNDKQKEMCTKEPNTPPTQQELFIELTKPIYSQAVSFIQSAYSRY